MSEHHIIPLKRARVEGDGGEDNNESIQRCINIIVHACTCRGAGCSRRACYRMKKLIAHIKTCRKRVNGSCPVCKVLINLCCYHAKNCVMEGGCQVPFCMNIRQKLMDQDQYPEDFIFIIMYIDRALVEGDGGGNNDIYEGIQALQGCINSIFHAWTCRDYGCRRRNCNDLKIFVAHARTCNKRKNGTCPACQQLYDLRSYHAKNCVLEGCQIPNCMRLADERRNAFVNTYMNRMMGCCLSCNDVHSGSKESLIDLLDHAKDCAMKGCLVPRCMDFRQQFIDHMRISNEEIKREGRRMIGEDEMTTHDGVIPIRVLVRVRPLSKKEHNENAQECVRTHVDQNQIACNNKLFAFDGVFDPSSSQEDVYLASAGVLIDKLFAGYNCTILAYGQTGSGKTHTMGTEETTSTMLAESRGIVPRIVSRIFEWIAETEQPNAFSVKVSMLEVYDDKVIDLLTRNPSREGLQIREKDGAPFVQGLSTHDVGSLETTMGILERGCALRSKGETAMNATSSRSHAVFTVHVEKTAVPNDESVWESKLRLVDLAGLERFKKSLAEGERKKEGIKINEGLHTLGKVIQALSVEEMHVPYRDSKITRLLQDSLGGSSYTVMIACLSPADSNGGETLSTLRYANRVKSIKNKPTVQTDPVQALIQKLRDEIAFLRLELAAYRGGEVPAIAVSLSSLPPSMNGPIKTQPLPQTDPLPLSTQNEVVIAYDAEIRRLKEEMEKMQVRNADKISETKKHLKAWKKSAEKYEKERTFELDELMVQIETEKNAKEEELMEEIERLTKESANVKARKNEEINNLHRLLEESERSIVQAEASQLKESRLLWEKEKKTMEEEKEMRLRSKRQMNALEEELERGSNEGRMMEREDDVNGFDLDNLGEDMENLQMNENGEIDSEKENDGIEHSFDEEEEKVEKKHSENDEIEDNGGKKIKRRSMKRNGKKRKSCYKRSSHSKSEPKSRWQKSEADLKCPRCQFHTRSAGSWLEHLRKIHSTTPRKAGVLLRCECGYEGACRRHAMTCDIANFVVIPKSEATKPTTPKCILCDKYPKTPYGYVQHLRLRHKSTLKESGIVIKCGCGADIHSYKNSELHSKKCDVIPFFVRRVDEKLPEDELSDEEDEM